MMRPLLPSLLLAGLLFQVGCATKRTITISTLPPDARIQIDGVDRGPGPLAKQQFAFRDSKTTHDVTATRSGYAPASVKLTAQYTSPDLVLELKRPTRRIAISVTPVPATIAIDSKPISAEPTAFVTVDLPFSTDASNRWLTHTITAEHDGYQKAEVTVSYQDADPTYQLNLEPMRKDLTIRTTPPGATVTLDGRELGRAPLQITGQPFAVDANTNQFLPHKLRLAKAGYDPVDQTISWDDGKQDYQFALAPKTKSVRIVTSPPGATVTIDGIDVQKTPDGASVATLPFPPVDDKGTLRTYSAMVTRKTADSEWHPQALTIAWDEGRRDYSVTLREVITRIVPLLLADPQRTDQGWDVLPRTMDTLAMKDVTEGAQKQSATQLTQLPPGTMIGSLAVSPDGSQVVFTVLTVADTHTLRSQLMAVNTSGSGGATMLTDGKTLDLTPAFTPDGQSIVFSSNRASRHLAVWQMAASGAPGMSQLTTGDTTDLWPSIDADPKPRLFYEARVDTRPDPRLYMTQLGTTIRTDLTMAGGAQPRISPKGDALLFTLVNDKTAQRDLYRVSDHGGVSENLTNTPDNDECDPVWSKDGSRIAFTSDRGRNEEGTNNRDIWVIDLSKPAQPIQVTVNGSWDDCPAWDPSGNFIYFRSNRGGQWNIWRVVVH